MTSPKEQFLKSVHREAHEKWSTTVAAEAARDAALLQFIHEQPDVIDPSRSWDQHSRLLGARRILDILYNLWAKDEPAKATRFPNIKPPS